MMDDHGRQICSITDFFLEWEHLYMKNPTTVSAKYRNKLEGDKIRFRATIKKFKTIKPDLDIGEENH